MARDYEKEAEDILSEVEGRTTEPKTGFSETTASKSARESIPSNLSTTAQLVGSMALPGGGAALGGRAAVAMAPRITSLAPKILGQMAGGGAGELASQALGITEPSNLGVAVNTVAPVAGRATAAIAQHAPRLLPNSVNAIRAGLTDKARALPDGITSPGVSYDSIPMQGQAGSFRAVDMPETAYTTASLRNELDNPIKALSQQRDSIKPTLDQIDAMLEGSNKIVAPGAGGKQFSLPTGLPKQSVPDRAPGLDFNELRSMTEDLGRRISATADPELRGAYRQLYKGVLTDLENMPKPAGEALDTWNKARLTYKRELAKTQLSEVIEKNIKSVEGVDQLRADPIIDFVRTNKEFRQRMDPKELASLEKELRNIASYTGKRQNKLLTILAGGAVGGTAGAAYAYVASDMIANALLKPGARKLLTKYVTANQGRFGQDAGAILAAAGAGALGNDPEVE